MHKLFWLSAGLLSACVTINIYFPAAAADKAADEIIQDIQDLKPDTPAAKPHSENSDVLLQAERMLDRAVSLIINNAYADEADLTLDSPDIRQIRADLEARFASLLPNYQKGSIGIQADGLLTIRDPSSLSLKDKASLTKLINAENADRLKLYQAIANANNHPEWREQIKQRFASRWVSHAQSGWWYQTANGIWKQQ